MIYLYINLSSSHILGTDTDGAMLPRGGEFSPSRSLPVMIPSQISQAPPSSKLHTPTASRIPHAHLSSPRPHKPAKQAKTDSIRTRQPRVGKWASSHRHHHFPAPTGTRDLPSTEVVLRACIAMLCYSSDFAVGHTRAPNGASAGNDLTSARSTSSSHWSPQGYNPFISGSDLDTLPDSVGRSRKGVCCTMHIAWANSRLSRIQIIHQSAAIDLNITRSRRTRSLTAEAGTSLSHMPFSRS
jgi:hypothetical protein